MREVIVIDREAEKVEAPSERVAIFIRPMERWRGKAALYQLLPAYEGFTHVVVSSITLPPPYPDSTETMIFGADMSSGQIKMEDELVTFRPQKSHKSALYALGYKLL